MDRKTHDDLCRYRCLVRERGAADVNHEAARKWLEANTQPLLTTDYVIDETLTFLKARGYGSLAIELGDGFFSGKLAHVVLISELDVKEAWSTLRRFRDKERSFTDCAGKAVMERLTVTQSFSFDHHFRQFGSVTVVP